MCISFTSPLLKGGRQNFFHACLAFEYLADAGFSEAFHSVVQRFLSQDVGGGAGDDELPDGVGDGHNFKDGGPAAVSCAPAFVAPHGAEGPGSGGHVQCFSHFLRQFVFFLAGSAEVSHEPLGDDGEQRGRYQERLDAHVDEPYGGAGGVVGVEGREDEVPGQGGPDGELGRLSVPDFSHHYFVGVLAEDGPEGAVEGESGPFVHLDLADAEDGVFHGVLHGDHVDFRLVDLFEDRVEGGGFSASRRPGDEDDAVGCVADLVHKHLVVGVEAQFGEAHHGVALVEDTDDYFFSVDGGQGGDPEVHPPSQDLDEDSAVLGAPFFRDVHA
ncbi:hypothetical protein SDC9_72475 [bioreactor metagenome]|uniref:Uncharacterized protein n=1 Tax=bioreactor metagenome TaxID=1076179 RepID=A0A644YIN4_9ZZZZ